MPPKVCSDWYDDGSGSKSRSRSRSRSRSKKTNNPNTSATNKVVTISKNWNRFSRIATVVDMCYVFVSFALLISDLSGIDVNGKVYLSQLFTIACTLLSLGVQRHLIGEIVGFNGQNMRTPKKATELENICTFSFLMGLLFFVNLLIDTSLVSSPAFEALKPNHLTTYVFTDVTGVFLVYKVVTYLFIAFQTSVYHLWI